MTEENFYKAKDTMLFLDRVRSEIKNVESILSNPGYWHMNVLFKPFIEIRGVFSKKEVRISDLDGILIKSILESQLIKLKEREKELLERLDNI